MDDDDLLSVKQALAEAVAKCTDLILLDLLLSLVITECKQ